MIDNIETLIADYEAKHAHQLSKDDQYMLDHYAGALCALRKLQRLNLTDKKEGCTVLCNKQKEKIINSVL